MCSSCPRLLNQCMARRKHVAPRTKKRRKKSQLTRGRMNEHRKLFSTGTAQRRAVRRTHSRLEVSCFLPIGPRHPKESGKKEERRTEFPPCLPAYNASSDNYTTGCRRIGSPSSPSQAGVPKGGKKHKKTPLNVIRSDLKNRRRLQTHTQSSRGVAGLLRLQRPKVHYTKHVHIPRGVSPNASHVTLNMQG